MSMFRYHPNQRHIFPPHIHLRNKVARNLRKFTLSPLLWDFGKVFNFMLIGSLDHAFWERENIVFSAGN